ncbi:hypothetical protein J4Q44_G00104180 [Coregonus suidteri]|uniref:Uncharacterized protein n=1 Tax=Coregonus suidteri TaxID=861788 RepID=A0AAN8RA10_9TELE
MPRQGHQEAVSVCGGKKGKLRLDAHHSLCSVQSPFSHHDGADTRWRSLKEVSDHITSTRARHRKPLLFMCSWESFVQSSGGSTLPDCTLHHNGVEDRATTIALHRGTAVVAQAKDSRIRPEPTDEMVVRKPRTSGRSGIKSTLDQAFPV